MKSVPASFIAMMTGWGLPLTGMAVGQLVTSGRTSDVGVTAVWVGLFALAGWLAVVVPAVVKFGDKSLICDVRWSWFGWSILGVAAHCALTVPVVGREMLVIVWYPALMGVIAGLVFALLVRGRKSTSARHEAE